MILNTRLNGWLPAICSIVLLCTLGSCTERRRATTPVPDGDTIEVVIPEAKDRDYPIRVIEVEDEPEAESTATEEQKIDLTQETLEEEGI